MPTRLLSLLSVPAVFTGVLIASAPPASAGSSVTYTVESDGDLSSVTYFDGMSDMQQKQNVSAPWTFTFTSQATYPMYGVGAQTNGLHVSCQISVNGQVKDKQSAQGRYAVVNCNAAG